MTMLLPTLASFSADTSVTIEVRGMPTPGDVTVWYLGDQVAAQPYDGSGSIDLGPLPVGCYGIELRTPDAFARTAVEVTADPAARLRYGFVVDYSPDRDVAGISDTVRRLHLNGIQFYDWAYRHADLLGGGESYLDALDQPITLDTVKALVGAVQAAGSRALGYAAVYAVGPQEWDGWKHRALLDANGEPFALGDFLFVLDPAATDWLEHFRADLVAATERLGFDGFHLDQYGYPKQARRPDGVVVDVAASFTTMIEAVRAALPASTLVFNNVNDFPTWATATTSQDAIYIEPWTPNTTLDALAKVVTRARSVAGGKPIAIAAYQHVYDSATTEQSDRATAFTMATLFSHGATQLLAGEADRILVDPYYVRNHVVADSTAAMLTRWYDFLVEHDELLSDPAIVEITGSVVGDYNGDLDVSFGATPVAENAEPGSVWRRVTSASGRYVVHLINLVGQKDTEWDAARQPIGSPGAGELRLRRVDGHIPRVQVADPDGSGKLEDLEVVVDNDYATATLPAIGTWQLVLVDPLHKQVEQ